MNASRRVPRVPRLPPARAAAPRENEPQVTSAFRQRLEQLVRLCRDLHLFDERHRRAASSPDTLEDAAVRNRESSSPRQPGFPRVPRHSSPSACRKQHLLERPESPPPLLKRSDPRAQPADRPGRHLQHVDAVRIDAALRVHGAVRRPSAEPRAAPHRGSPAPAPLKSRRRDVDALFEERTVERIGLVEDRERAEAAVRETPRPRTRAGDEPLDQQLAFEPGPLRADVDPRQERRDALKSGDQLRRRCPRG